MTKRIDFHYVIFMFKYEAKKILRPKGSTESVTLSTPRPKNQFFMITLSA